jgi:hypothetical protein
MEQSKIGNRAGWPTTVAVGLVVFAFMGLSLAVTTIGTARFAVALGYSPIVGYVVGAIFDIAKEILPLAIRALCKRRVLVISIILCIAWIGLVTYSVLATHATITTVISAIERTGTWKKEIRTNVQTELGSVEQQLAALSRPTPPRPLKTVRAALAAERVPPSIWKDSRECAAIQESAYFAKACAQVAKLRTELSTAEDYERLSARANELRTNLAETPIIDTSDPLPEAFAATLGRVLNVGGTEGWRDCSQWWSRLSVVLASPHSAHSTTRTIRLPRQGVAMCALYQRLGMAEGGGKRQSRKSSLSPQRRPSLAPPQSLQPPDNRSLEAASGRNVQGVALTSSRCGPLPPPRDTAMQIPNRSREDQQGVPAPWARTFLHLSRIASGEHPDFRLAQPTLEMLTLLGARSTATHHSRGKSIPPELEAMGFTKWKSCGRMRYRDLQLVA